MTPYGDTKLDQHWLMYRLVAWRHQAIIWTIVDLLSVKPNNIRPKTISSEIPEPPNAEIGLKSTHLELIKISIVFLINDEGVQTSYIKKVIARVCLSYMLI